MCYPHSQVHPLLLRLVIADIWAEDRDLRIRLPLFRARMDFFETFREYLFEEDIYGMAYRYKASEIVVAQLLERHGVLQRSLPNCGGIFPHPASRSYIPGFEATAHYPGEAEEDRKREVFSYFPMGARMTWMNMAPVRVFL